MRCTGRALYTHQSGVMAYEARSRIQQLPYVVPGDSHAASTGSPGITVKRADHGIDVRSSNSLKELPIIALSQEA